MVDEILTKVVTKYILLWIQRARNKLPVFKVGNIDESNTNEPKIDIKNNFDKANPMLE